MIDQYGSTPAGNLARHYAGICYLRMGDLDNAAAYLSEYHPVKGIPGAIVNAQNLGLQGDVAVEQQDYARALKFYDKAVKASDNQMTAPLYLRKAGLAAKAMATTPFRRLTTSASWIPIPRRRKLARPKSSSGRTTDKRSAERWQPEPTTFPNSTRRCPRLPT